MSEMVKGKTTEAAKDLALEFSKMLLNQTINTEKLDEAIAFEGVKDFPARIKCATLGWKALESAIKEVNLMSKIPKVIHYCWFGPNPIPEIFKSVMSHGKSIAQILKLSFGMKRILMLTQMNICPKLINEEDLPKFNDYARLKIINENGGIYLDIDVELIKSIDELLNYDII
jgi:mannosyltransferase OCH1-like enzyme